MTYRRSMPSAWGRSAPGAALAMLGVLGIGLAVVAPERAPVRPVANVSASVVNVLAWGENGNGQAGGSSASANQLTPRIQASLPHDVTQVAAGGFHSLALRAGGTVLAWGANVSGELGPGVALSAFNPTPQPVPGISGVVQLAAGDGFSLALRSDGTVWGWGDNTFGEMGVGADPVHQLTPRQVSGLSQVVKIAAGNFHGLALLADGTVRAWGANQDGQLGNGQTSGPMPVPVVVAGLSGVSKIGAGWAHSLAVLSDGTVRAWGANDAGQLGNGTQSASSTPVAVAGLNNVVQVAGGEADSVALRSDGTVWAWGANTLEEVDASGDTFVLAPRRVPTLTGVTQVAAGANHNLAVARDGSLWAWGDGQFGQRGDGTGFMESQDNVSTPVRAVGIAEVVNIAAGGYHGVATSAAAPPQSHAPDVTGTVGVPVNFSLAPYVSGGIAPYHWFPSLTFTLPPGLTLDQNTGQITGAPAISGTYTFSFEVIDALGVFTDDSMIWVINSLTVPRIIGDTVSEAQSDLGAVNLFLGNETDRTTTNCDLVGTISGQNPAAGSVISTGAFVNYTLWVLKSGAGCQ